MSLGKYILLALSFFIVGLAVLYLGVNRAPFRQAPPMTHPAKQHGQAPADIMTGTSFLVMPLPGTD
jgi:hypothetical protein